jgi:hypothetical protein
MLDDLTPSQQAAMERLAELLVMEIYDEYESLRGYEEYLDGVLAAIPPGELEQILCI